VKIAWLVLVTVVFGATIAAHSRSDDNTDRLVGEAIADINQKRFDAALGHLREAERRDPNSGDILNLLGAVYTKMKDYAQARSYFERSLAQEPTFFAPAFNLGELLFLEKQYPQALEAFSKLLIADPDNELLQFKIVLCLSLLDRAQDARVLVARMKFPGNSPAWYYARAALEMRDGDPRTARKLLATARVIFPEATSLYDETFETLDWPTR
jgi:tetratricopeptide (TPR) repeat protein